MLMVSRFYQNLTWKIKFIKRIKKLNLALKSKKHKLLRKIKLHIIIILLLKFKINAQVNLVQNGDLETYSQCPDFISQINYADNWSTSSNGTPDYLNLCNPNNPNPINTNFGGESPHSGNGIVGMVCYANAPGNYNKREYIQVMLSQPLSMNTKYRLSYFVSLADESKYSISNIDCYFGIGSSFFPTDLSIPLSPQIKNDTSTYFNVKTGWQHFEKYYIATGGEDYLILGNFNNDLNTNTNYNGIGLLDASYYFFDDVSVIDSASIGINVINNNSNISIYPNPTNSNIQIDVSKLNELGDLQFIVFDALGLEVKRQLITDAEITNITLSELANGTYFYKVMEDGKLLKYDKLVLIK